MGVPMTVKIDGLACQLTHEPSGAQLRTVPPKDNGGDGTSFSPTDLVGAALASCALSTMALIAPKEGLAFGAASARVEKEMVGPPRRIGALSVAITMPRDRRGHGFAIADWLAGQGSRSSRWRPMRRFVGDNWRRMEMRTTARASPATAMRSASKRS